MTELWICRHTDLAHNEAHIHAEVLLRSVLASRHRAGANTFSLARGKYGKPYLINNAVRFSLSYTFGAFVLAVSDSEIGADVEQLRTGKRYAAKRCFTDAEKRYLYEDAALFDTRFYELWTQKEAYLKYMGRGFYQSPQGIDVLSAPIRNYLSTVTDDDIIISLCRHTRDRVHIYRKRM